MLLRSIDQAQSQAIKSRAELAVVAGTRTVTTVISYDDLSLLPIIAFSSVLNSGAQYQWLEHFIRDDIGIFHSMTCCKWQRFAYPRLKLSRVNFMGRGTARPAAKPVLPKYHLRPIGAAYSVFHLSVTAIIRPRDSSAATRACSPRAGRPIRIAVATVSG